MGMYTELIFGAGLKKETPASVIEALKYMLGDVEEKPKDFPLPNGRCEWLFQSTSYFGMTVPANKFVFDNDFGVWCLSTRSSIKNYGGEIEDFLTWIKPFICCGSGNRNMYALTIYEDSEEPIIYYLD